MLSTLLFGLIEIFFVIGITNHHIFLTILDKRIETAAKKALIHLLYLFNLWQIFAIGNDFVA